MSQLIKIHNLGSSGEGIGKLDELIIFVEGALPGEEVLVEVETRKKNYAVARLVEVVKSSLERVEPFCPLYKNCGGCQLQHLSYPAQLKWKRQQVVDSVERIGKPGDVEIFDTLGMENPLPKCNSPLEKILKLVATLAAVTKSLIRTLA